MVAVSVINRPGLNQKTEIPLRLIAVSLALPHVSRAGQKPFIRLNCLSATRNAPHSQTTGLRGTREKSQEYSGST